MKFQPDTIDGVNVVTRREPAGVWVGSTRYGHSVLVPWIGAVLPWGPATHAELSAAHFECILALRPEVVIFGSGARLRFPPAAMLRALIERRIGVETMDTPAACRTYNVLAGERRAVVGAFLIAPAQTPLSKQDGRGPDDFIMPS